MTLYHVSGLEEPKININKPPPRKICIGRKVGVHEKRKEKRKKQIFNPFSNFLFLDLHVTCCAQPVRQLCIFAQTPNLSP